MHKRHASEQETELAILSESGSDDSSIQGTINKVVIAVRDWISDIDQDVLPAVRMGEESLLEKYNKALDDSQFRDHPSILTMMATQLEEIGNEISKLPKA
jgi:hypothetical protein